MKFSTKGLNWQVSNDRRHYHVGECGLCQLCTWTTVTYLKRALAHPCNSEVLRWILEHYGPINGCFCGYYPVHFHWRTYECLSCSTLQNKALLSVLKYSPVAVSATFKGPPAILTLYHTLKGKGHSYTDILVIIPSVL